MHRVTRASRIITTTYRAVKAMMELPKLALKL